MPQAAFIDESCRQRTGDSHAYALAAVTLALHDADRIRETLKQLRAAKNPTVHWRNESPARRIAIVRTIVGLPVHGTVAVCLYATNRSGHAEAAWPD